MKRGYISIVPLSNEEEIILNESDLKNFTILDDVYTPEEGFIGSVISKQLTLNLFKPSNIDLTDREVKAFIGVDVGNTTKYVPYGTFIIQKPENETLTEKTSFEALDFMVKFNLPYEDTLTYPCTLKTVLNAICEQAGVVLGTTAFPNENFVVENNQFVAGESCREVLKAIAQLAGASARIGRNNRLYLIFLNSNQNEIIDETDYMQNIKINNTFGPVNRLVLRMSQVEGENVVVEDTEAIERDGVKELVISDNPFTYTQAKREQAITAIWNRVKGITYTDFETKVVPRPYLDPLDKISINVNGELKCTTYLFSHEITYSGGLTGKMSNTVDTETETKYAYTPTLSQRVKHTEIVVDKANQNITLIAEEQTEQSERITLVDGKVDTTAANLSTFINTTYAQDISNIQQQIDGAIQFWNGAVIPTLNNYPANQWTTEADRVNHQADIYTVIEDVEGELKQGKSYRFDKVNNVWQWIELTDNELSAVQALANSKAKVYVVTPIPPYNVGDLWLKDQELYECIRAKDNAGTFSQSDWQKATKYTDDTKANEVDAKLTTTNQKVSTIELNLESITETVEQTSTGLREVKEELDAEDSFTRQKSIQIEAAEATLDDVYMYGELEQETTTGKNKFDKNAATQGYYIDSTGELVENSSSYVSDYIPVTANQQITMSGNTYIQESYGSKACFYDSNKNFVSYVSIATGNNTYTVPSNASYFRTTIRNVDIDTLQVENGSTATEYEEYTGGIAAPNPDKEMPISVIGKNINLLDLSNMEIGTKNGVTLSRNNDGTYHLKGTATNATHFLADYTIPSSWLGKTMTMSSEQVVTWGNVGFKEGTAPDKFIIARNGKSKTQEITQDVIETVTKFDIYVPNGNTVDIDVKIKVEEGTIATGYTEYNRGGIDYKVTGDSEKKVTIELPENEFLANIGKYEDYIDSTGVLHKVIGKVVLDGSDDESLPLNSRLTNTLRFDLPILTDGKLINANKVVCNRFTSVYGNTSDYEHCRNSGSSYPTTFIFYINKSRLNGYDDSLTSTQVSELVRAWLKENPLEIYYILETPYNALLEENEIKKYLALPTIKGTNNIEITAPTSATYKRDTELNAVYAKRKYVDEKFAQQEITNESITNTVSSSQILIANNTNSIDEVNNAIAGLNGSTNQIQEDLEATKQELSTQLQQTNTSFQASINEINTTLANGVASTSVKTTTGTFDNEGLHIKKSDSEMESLLNNEGLYVNKGNQNQLTCDKDGVITENLYVRTYLTAGYHRTEGFIENGEKRTGVFYQGGVE